MSKKKKYREAYSVIRKAIKELGGTLTWKNAGYGGGGDWTIGTIPGFGNKPFVVPCRNKNVNALDRLYVHPDSAKTWADVEHPGTLWSDWIVRLVVLIRVNEKEKNEEVTK